MSEDEGLYWDQRWREGDTGWDIRGVSPPLQQYFQQLPDKAASILIPGCGNAYEAAWLLDHGFTNITLLDISKSLTQRLREQFPVSNSLTILTADFFRHKGQYDLIIEQTFFCALDPGQREAYVQQTHNLLRPGGKLAGLLFDRDFPGGPPYGGHKLEYQNLLEKRYLVKTLAPCYNSIKPRTGTELFFIAIRTAPVD
jgi:SAM-dependent methyltransferase